MIRLAIPCALGGVLVAVATPARAVDAETSVTLGLATEYVFRGVGQTEGQPALSVAADFTRGEFYGGVWASNVEYSDGTDAEVDLYGGLRREIGAVTIEAGAIVYLYPGQPASAAYDYVEARLTGSRAFGPVTGSVSAYWTPDYGGPAEDGLYAEGTVTWALDRRWSVSGAVGVQSLESSEGDYAQWNLGLTYAATPSLLFDLRYHDTDADLGEAYEPRAVLSLKATY